MTMVDLDAVLALLDERIRQATEDYDKSAAGEAVEIRDAVKLLPARSAVPAWLARDTMEQAALDAYTVAQAEANERRVFGMAAHRVGIMAAIEATLAIVTKG